MKRMLTLALSLLLLLAGCGSVPTINIGGQDSSQAASSAPAIAAYPETMHLDVNGQDTIQVSGAEARDLIWASSNRSVAIVDESGKVTAQGAGNCTITIASKTDSGVSCHVEVVVAAGSSHQPAAAQAQPDQLQDETVVHYVAESNPASVYPSYALSSAEVQAMDAEETQFVINQIYAKNGYIFRTDSLQAYFSQMPWYTPVSNDASQLRMSSLDQNNLALLVKHRDGMSTKPSSLGWIWTYRAVSSPLTASYVRNLSKADVQLLINTIYAKNGYIFDTPELQRLFEGQSWYHGVTGNMGAVTFSSMDRENLNLLLQYR